MKIYHYAPRSKELSGSGIADESPLEPGVFLIPANATTIEPPFVPEGQVAVWNGDGWSVATPSIDADNVQNEYVNEVPQQVTRFQARAALAQAGYFSAVNSYMATLPVDNIMRLAWDDATTFERGSATVAAMAAMLGLNASQVDDLFIAAKGISA